MQRTFGNSQQDRARLYEPSRAQREQLDRVEAEMREILGEAEPDDISCPDNLTRDHNAIDDERVFIHRFGFDWPRSDRIGLIALKHRLDLTDREIRLLKRTGNLKRRQGMVTLRSTRWAAIFGRCLATFALFEFGTVMLLELLTIHHALSGLQVAKLYGMTAFVLAMVWLVYLGYIKPWVIEQRVMKKTAPDAQ